MSPIGNYCLASIAILYIWHSIFCTICGENEGYLQIFMWVLRLMNEFVIDFFFLCAKWWDVVKLQSLSYKIEYYENQPRRFQLFIQ